MATPSFLLYEYHASAWNWHALAVLAALAIGFTPMPAEWKAPAFDLIFGIGGLAAFPIQHGPRHGHRHHHA
jgi:hypothetical protein